MITKCERKYTYQITSERAKFVYQRNWQYKIDVISKTFAVSIYFLAQIPIAPVDRTVLFAKCFYPNIGLASISSAPCARTARAAHTAHLPYIDSCQASERNCDTIIIHAGGSILWTDSPFFTTLIRKWRWGNLSAVRLHTWAAPTYQ